MTIARPSPADLIALAGQLHMNLGAAEAEEYLALMQGMLDDYDLVDGLPDFIPEVRYPRDAGHRPDASESVGNAWYWKANVAGATDGPLAGKTIALKDNINLAGVPMMNGSATLEGFVPTYDATIVTRLLDAGGTILGKATCEHFCLSGGSHTSDPAPVHNPRRPGHSAGGSSSGSAALVAAGEVDIAIGGDQGGSIRIPSAFCGTYGMKPTHGLVPYTGIMPIEATIDHCGPITANVRDNALALEILAGADGLDPRQYGAKAERYTDALDWGVKDLRIGLLAEGFSLPGMMPEIADSVRAAAAVLEGLGAIVEPVSVAEHGLACSLWTPIGCEGLLAEMMHANGAGHNWQGLYDVALLDRHADWRTQADRLTPSLKLCMLVGEYGACHLHGHYYAKAQNIRRRVKQAFDAVFSRYDLLLMPTVPIVAKPLPGAEASATEIVSRALEMIGNTAPYDITGHPAMSVPCGIVDDLPVGMMLVADSYQESIIYQAAAAYEAHNCGSACKKDPLAG